MEINDVNLDSVLTLANGTKKRCGDWTKQDLFEAAEYVRASAEIRFAIASEHHSALALLTDSGCINLDEVIVRGGEFAEAAVGILARAETLESELASRLSVGQP